MKEHASHLLQVDQLIYTSCRSSERAYEINKQEPVLYFAIACLQEETDSRIILHAVVATEKDSR